MANSKNPKVDEFINNAKNWKEEFEKLRLLLLDCQLTEDFKWGKPSYSYQGNNIVIIQGFKEYCALLFFKGSLLRDTNNILIRQTENVQAGRQIRFLHVAQIIEMEAILKAYVYEAIDIEKAGLEVIYKKNEDYVIPDEFQNKLNEFPELKTAFEALTPGRQRGYLLYFSEPKQSKTREARIDKYIPQILNGKGLQ